MLCVQSVGKVTRMYLTSLCFVNGVICQFTKSAMVFLTSHQVRSKKLPEWYETDNTIIYKHPWIIHRRTMLSSDSLPQHVTIPLIQWYWNMMHLHLMAGVSFTTCHQSLVIMTPSVKENSYFLGLHVDAQPWSWKLLNANAEGDGEMEFQILTLHACWTGTSAWHQESMLAVLWFHMLWGHVSSLYFAASGHSVFGDNESLAYMFCGSWWCGLLLN